VNPERVAAIAERREITHSFCKAVPEYPTERVRQSRKVEAARQSPGGYSTGPSIHASLTGTP